MSKIDSKTLLKLGTIVIKNDTKELFTIGRIVNGKYEMRPNGKRTDIAHGVIFVASIEELSNNYELLS